ncbi:unnamed protein product [Schistosoma turkestanicum]|nr:unnamed protein product [Schistosoma turkestanicum]
MAKIIKTNMLDSMITEATNLVERTFTSHNDNKERAERIEREFQKYMSGNRDVGLNRFRCVNKKYTTDYEQSIIEFEPENDYLFIAFVIDDRIVFLGDIPLDQVIF